MTDAHPQNKDGQIDVAVIGGGPGGSTVSTLIAQQGYRVQLFERERFPRFHIGESLIPETYWVLERLGMLDKMKSSRFVEKYSVQFVSASGKLSEPFYFMDHKPHDCSRTWQVLRSEFDQLMLENARAHGVEAFEATRVQEVLMDGDRTFGLRVADQQGRQRKVLARVVVDASGQSSMLASRLKLREIDADLKKGALWTYYEGAYRDAGRDEGATMILQTRAKKGWFWYIPLHNNIVSVGVVAAFDHLFKDRRDYETIYNEQLDACPAAKERVSIGRRASGFYATKDYSYRSRRAAGDGWVLVGDAYGFLDPLYSSGVLLALRSGQMAADAIVEGLARGDLSAAQLGKWAPAFTQGMDRMRRLVCEFYDGFSFGRFVRRYPHFKGHLTDLLIGDLFKESVDEVVEPMNLMRDEMKQAAEA
ncbi:MAG: tryptophan 7-halogenase [Planctomycetia bacterium]|nr:tryptophan 7-halogenase [Planctomycetia bacterium]